MGILRPNVVLGFDMKRFWAMVCALLLSVSLLLTSCANVPTGLTGNFREDTLSLISSLREAIALPDNDPNKKGGSSRCPQKA